MISLNIPIILLLSVAAFFMIANLPPVFAEEDANMLFEKGKESYMAGNSEEAISYFEKVLQIEPNHVDALNNIGAILITLDKHEEAIPFFDQVLAIEPNHVGGLSNKGSALGSLGEFDDSMLNLNRALEIEPNHIDALSNKAAVFVDQEQHYDAITIFHNLLKIDPDNEIAKEYLPKAKVVLGYAKVEVFTEFILRN